MNPGAVGMLHVGGRHLGEPLARVVRMLRVDGTAVPDAESPILAPLRDRRPYYATDAIFMRTDGSSFPADFIATPMIERGEVTGLVVSFRDVTERRRVEADLQRSHRQLQETITELTTMQRQALQQERLRAMGQMASASGDTL